MSNRKTAPGGVIKPLPSTSTSPGQDPGGSGDDGYNRIPGNWSTPGSPGKMDGEYNPIPANWSTPGTRVYGGETYCDGDNENGPTSRSGSVGKVLPMPATSTSPPDYDDGGEYCPTHFNMKDTFPSQPAPVDTSEGMKTMGYKRLGVTNPETDRLIPNCDPAHEGNWSYEQQSYFTTPDYDGDGDE